MRGPAPCLVGWAGLAEARGQPEQATRLLGAAKPAQKLKSVNLAIPLCWFEYERVHSAARACLEPATFAAAWAEGQAMALEQATAYALACQSVGHDGGTAGRAGAG